LLQNITLPLLTIAPTAGLNAVAAAEMTGLNGLTTLSTTVFAAFLMKRPAFESPVLILFQSPQVMIFNTYKNIFLLL
jgi:hypothetical protein